MLRGRNRFSAVIVCSLILFGPTVGMGARSPSSFLEEIPTAISRAIRVKPVSVN